MSTNWKTLSLIVLTLSIAAPSQGQDKQKDRYALKLVDYIWGQKIYELHRLNKGGSTPATNYDRAVGFLLKHVDSKDPKKRAAVFKFLGRAKQSAKQVVPVLIKELPKPQNAKISFHITDSLGNFGEGAKAALPALLAHVKAPSNFSRSTLEAIAKVDPAGQSFPELLKYAQAMGLEGRSEFAEGLGTFKERGKAAIPLLLKWAKDATANIRKVMRGLAKIDSRGDSVKELLRIFKTAEGSRRRDFIQAFPLFGPRAAPAVPVLLKMLDKQSKDKLAGEACAVLGQLAIQAEVVVPALIKTLQHPDLALRWHATQSLACFNIEIWIVA